MNLDGYHLPTLQMMANQTQGKIDALNATLAGAMLTSERRTIQREISALVDQIRVIRAEIRVRQMARECPVPRVTEHAMIRYLDRELNYDIADLESLILTEDVRRQIEEGATSIPLPSGNVLVVRGKAIVTVAPAREVRK